MANEPQYIGNPNPYPLDCRVVLPNGQDVLMTTEMDGSILMLVIQAAVDAAEKSAGKLQPHKPVIEAITEVLRDIQVDDSEYFMITDRVASLCQTGWKIEPVQD